MTDHLRPLILEIAQQLDFLPTRKISAIISKMIIDVLPEAVLQMNDIAMPSEGELRDMEFRTRRRGGKKQDDIDEEIASRREVYEEIRNAKSVLTTEYAAQGTALLTLAMKESNSSFALSTMQSSLSNVANWYITSNQL